MSIMDPLNIGVAQFLARMIQVASDEIPGNPRSTDYYNLSYQMSQSDQSESKILGRYFVKLFNRER